MIPRFFGTAGEALYGVYHPPTAPAARAAGVILCYPGPQEYRQAHWAYRRLATALAAGGLHVLRFDYYATGDSAGASEQGTLARWVADVGDAARELRDLAGVRRVALVGMRLGAAVAARARAAGLPVGDLVLWDPVVSGARYLDHLERVQARTLRARTWPQADRVGPHELLGYPLAPAERAAVAGVDLAREPLGAPARALVVAAAAHADADALHARLTGDGVAATALRVADPSLAGDTWHADTLLPHAGAAAIVAHLARRAA